MAEQGRYVAAICAAPKVLVSARLVEGRAITAYPGVLDDQEGIRLSSAAVVRDGTFITSRGPGTALDFALTLIETLCGRASRDNQHGRRSCASANSACHLSMQPPVSAARARRAKKENLTPCP